MNLRQEIEKMTLIIDEELRSLMQKKEGYQGKIFEAMEYSLFTGGKRIRPILLLKSCELVKGDYEEAIPFALAIEMIHTYSLIHDDLPAMDDDDYRRGKLTNHKVYGDAMAILAGDGLLNLAYETIIKYMLNNMKENKNTNRYIEAFDEIAKAAGVDGMIGGQVVDILSDEINIDKEILHFMYKSKTASLIDASVVAGGIIGGANRKEINSLRDYGYSIGFGYQIRDDILDKREDEEIGKKTYLTFYSIDEAESKIAELSLKANEALKTFNSDRTEFLNSLAKILINREK